MDEWLSVVPVEDSTTADKTKWKPADPDTAAAVSALMHYAPGMALSAYNGTYKVIFPKGTAGIMKMAKDGKGYLPTLFDENGHFAENARLIRLNGLKVADAAFNILSMVTMQHYLSEINSQLNEIRSQIDQVKTFLYMDKACELRAEVRAVERIYQNYTSVMAQPELRSACLCTVQQARIVAEQNIQFYYLDIQGMANRDINVRDQKVADEIIEKLENYRLSIELYGFCTFMEVTLSQNLDRTYLAFCQQECETQSRDYFLSIAELSGKVQKAGSPRGFALPMPGQDAGAKTLRDLKKEISKRRSESDSKSRYAEILREIQEESEQPREYFVSGGQVFEKLK